MNFIKIVITAIIVMAFIAPLIANPFQAELVVVNIYLEDSNGVVQLVGNMTVNLSHQSFTVDLSNHFKNTTHYTTLILENAETGETLQYPDPGVYVPIEIELFPGRVPMSY